MITNDAVVSIGLFLFAIDVLACYCVAMLVVSVLLSVEYIMALALVALSLIPFAALLWTIIEAVLSSNNTVFFCFMEVIKICGIYCVAARERSHLQSNYIVLVHFLLFPGPHGRTPSTNKNTYKYRLRLLSPVLQ